MRRLVFVVCLASLTCCADDIADTAARIESLAAKEPLIARADSLRQGARLLDSTHPDLARELGSLASCIVIPESPARFALPKLAADNALLERLVEEVEHNGDDPAAYDALAAFIRAHRLSAGLDNPSIRARIALADLSELLDPILIALDGSEVRLSRYRSKPVLLAFWATWCVPCRAELSKLEKLSETSPEIAILALSWEPRDVVRRFLEEHPYKVPVFIDSAHKLADRYHIDELPATVELPGTQAAAPVLR